MNFLDPWSHIDINPVRKNETLQFFDNKIRIIYSLAGSVHIKWKSDKTVLGDDDFFILTKSEQYEVGHTKGKVYCFSLDYFKDKELDQVNYLFRGDSVNKVRRTDFDISQSLRQFLLMKATHSQTSNSIVYKEYFSLVLTLEKYYATEIKFNASQQGQNRIDEVRLYIDHYFDQELSLSNLAQKLFVSEQYLSKSFKERVGIGVSEYIIRKRLEKVRRLLTESELPITDIAFSSGFSNINSFNRLFKKYQGLTPSEFRNETKKNIIIQSQPQEMIEAEFEDIRQYLENDFREVRESHFKISVASSQPFSHHKMMINLGYAGDLLHRSYIRHIKPISQYAEFGYGRVTGLISQTILSDEDGFFDFAKVDDIIQAVLDLGLKPFLELGLKGKVIHGTNRQIITHSFVSLPNQNMEELLHRYRILIEHCIETFGEEEVRTWVVELWKPNALVLGSVNAMSLAYFDYQGKLLDLTTTEGYFQYFTLTYKTLKSLLPDLKIGGCGISVDIEGRETEDFLLAWDKKKVKPDFISMYVFPMDRVKEKALQRSEFYISPDSDYLIRAVRNIKHILSQTNLQSELYLTEFNVTISGRDIINDTCFKGPYILKNTLPIMDEVDLLGYWQLSDFSSNAIDVANDEIFGGSGLVTKNGIPKPAFYAFDFISHLGDRVLHLSEGLIVTKKAQKIMILAYHYCHLNSQYYYVDEQMFDKTNALEMFEQDGVSKLDLLLTDLSSQGSFQIKQRKMGISSGAILGEVNRFGTVTKYRSDEVDYLQHRCLPMLSREYMKSDDKGLALSIELHPHDMIFLEITPD